MKTLTFLFLLAPLIYSCNTDKERFSAEVLMAEASFQEHVTENGVKAAFLEFAADSAVINRSGKLIKGKEAIGAYFDTWTYSDIKLTWQPEFVEVAESGDLAYTFGPYQFKALDTAGNLIETEGIFHTVWKKQPDGTWKYVYD